ncbi:VOC family protein [Micrococcales bacterium 31B]|nr:VOC family protein [Micrococcales bacterium 31B]
MAMHRLNYVTMGVPDVAATAAYYEEFGLTPTSGNRFATEDGGEQLRIEYAPMRRLVELSIGCDDRDDLERITTRLAARGLTVERQPDSLTVTEPVTGVRAIVEVTSRLVQPEVPPTPYNGPGRVERTSPRAPGLVREGPVKPKRLGHVVLGTTDLEATFGFFVEGLGFQPSDYIVGHGAFLRCSTDHHNVLVMSAPVTFLHHTSWQVEDVDEIGRGAMRMLENNPDRHVWGLGRHYAGSNFFWYLKDPAGNFSEYYADMDCIVEGQLWTPEDLEGAKGLFSWGPPPPASFLNPEDLAAHMTGAHDAA